jgi:hypothetical protein
MRRRLNLGEKAMNFARNRNLWISVAAGAFLAAAVVTVRNRSPRRKGALFGRYRPRVFGGPSGLLAWRFDHQFRTLPAGKVLRMEFESPAVVHWTVNQWDHVEDTRTTEIAPGVHVVDLATEKLKPGARVQFTFFWPGVNRWEGEDFELKIEPAKGEAARTASD